LIEGADGQGNRLIDVQGLNLNASTRVIFDGAPGNLLAVNADGSLLVAPPPGPGGYSSAVEALNSDGQTSWQQLGTALPPVFTYDPASAPAVVVNSTGLLAGTDAMVEIGGVNTNFVDGQTVVGFGSSDISVQRVWVLSPTHLQVNVRVSAQAVPGLTGVTVDSGLQLMTANSVLQVNPANTSQLTVRTPIVSQVTNLAGIPQGGFAMVFVPSAPQNLAGWTVSIGGQRVAALSGGAGIILAQVPSSVPAGPAVVQVSDPSGTSAPAVLMQVDPPAPAILSAVNASGSSLDVAHAALPGDTITIAVAGIADLLPVALVSRLQISVGGIIHAAASVTASQVQPGVYLIQLILAPSVPFGPQTQVYATYGTRVSSSFGIAIRTS
jgi:uncharacterized protein (TIGR03437 family)